MARKRHTAKEIVAKLRQVDVLMAQGRLVADAASRMRRRLGPGRYFSTEAAVSSLTTGLLLGCSRG
jgi:hypothetical protein